MKPQDDWDLVEKILDMNQADFAAKINEKLNKAGEEDEEVEDKAVLCCAVL